MKYNIEINQKAIVDNGFDLDIYDAAVLSYIKDFALSNKIVKVIIDGQEYFWIQYKHLIDEMPMLKLSKDKLKHITNKLSELGILEKKLLNNNSTYFKFGDKYSLLISDTEGGEKPQGGCDKNHKGVGGKTTSINNNIKNNNTNNNIISKDITEETSEYGKPEINNIINLIKQFCLEHGIIYDKTQDRMYAKHICSAKEYNCVAESYKLSAAEFTINVMKASMQVPFWRGKLCGPKSIYTHYAKVINDFSNTKHKEQGQQIASIPTI